MKSVDNQFTTTNQQATETTPLNQVVSQTTEVSSKMDSETKRVLVKIGFDVVLLCCGEFS